MAKKVFAFTGKGGVGKTSLSALMVRLLIEKYPDAKILAIDADPAVGLSTALGVKVNKTINDIRLNFIDELKRPDKPSAIEVLNDAHYEVTDCVIDCGKFCFLAIGRPEGSGCYCSVNGFLRDIISELVKNFDYVVIDGEAGIEQVNRRVLEKISDLILVSDSSKKGIDVIHTIKEVAKGLGMYSRDYTIINRVTHDELLAYFNIKDLNVVGIIHEDNELGLLDIKGFSMFELNENSITIKALKEILQRMENEQ